MIDTNPQDPGVNRTGARQFFYMYYMADFLQDEHSVQEALHEYIEGEDDDLGAQRLIQDVKELLNSGMSEQELVHLVEEVWKTRRYSQLPNFKYRDILKEMLEILKPSKK